MKLIFLEKFPIFVSLAYKKLVSILVERYHEEGDKANYNTQQPTDI